METGELIHLNDMGCNRRDGYERRCIVFGSLFFRSNIGCNFDTTVVYKLGYS